DLFRQRLLRARPKRSAAGALTYRGAAMRLDDFGMDALTLPGTLDGKLDAIRKAGFSQVMLSAADLAGYPGGEDEAIRVVRESGLRVTGLQVLREFEGLSGQLHDYKVEVAKS